MRKMRLHLPHDCQCCTCHAQHTSIPSKQYLQSSMFVDDFIPEDWGFALFAQLLLSKHAFSGPPCLDHPSIEPVWATSCLCAALPYSAQVFSVTPMLHTGFHTPPLCPALAASLPVFCATGSPVKRAYYEVSWSGSRPCKPCRLCQMTSCSSSGCKSFSLTRWYIDASRSIPIPILILPLSSCGGSLCGRI